METIIVPRSQVDTWELPPFQRPLRINDRVRSLVHAIKENGGVLSGVITLGRIGQHKTLYIVDGQHRVAAFKMSECQEWLIDLRICHFNTMAEMADEFVRLNSAIVRMRPDDILRGMEQSTPSLGIIRRRCNFVGYDQIRRAGKNSDLVGMSAVLRTWTAGMAETPSSSHVAGRSAAQVASDMTTVEAEQLCRFLNTCHQAWGSDPQNFRLWNTLNLTLCVWMWHQLVVKEERGVKRYVKLTPEDFRKCLMSVSAESTYIDWLVNRQLTERDRAPGYNRLKSIFAGRLRQESSVPNYRPLLPQPTWAA